MKIDMSPEAVKRRLEQMNALRELCLSLARSSSGRKVMADHAGNVRVRRTAEALGLGQESKRRVGTSPRRPRQAHTKKTG